jgi:hypothetical protein
VKVKVHITKFITNSRKESKLKLTFVAQCSFRRFNKQNNNQTPGKILPLNIVWLSSGFRIVVLGLLRCHLTV